MPGCIFVYIQNGEAVALTDAQPQHTHAAFVLDGFQLDFAPVRGIEFIQWYDHFFAHCLPSPWQVLPDPSVLSRLYCWFSGS